MAEENIQVGTTDTDWTALFGVTKKFATLNRLISRDLNEYVETPTFSIYKKTDIQRFLSNPYKYEKELRRAVVYIYGASSHFRRLIQHFVSLSDLAYIIEPYKVDPSKANKRTAAINYRKVLNALSAMDIKSQFPKILTVCLREDTFYGTMHVTADDIIIQQLPSDYCAITTIEGNVPNVTFNFSYFDSNARRHMLEHYPPEFQTKYELYKTRRAKKWIELDSPTSFAVKCNSDIMEYPMPPFAGILRNLFDLEDLNGRSRSWEHVRQITH